MLTRRTPLRAKNPLKARATLARRRSRLTRTAPPQQKTSRRRRRPAAYTGPDQATRMLVFMRDQGRCVVCGHLVDRAGDGWSVHHRQNRGMGGRRGAARAVSNSPANLVLVCGSGTSGCHGDITEGRIPDARRFGYVIPTNATVDHATVPIRTPFGWRLLDHEGGYTDLPDYRPEEVG